MKVKATTLTAALDDSAVDGGIAIHSVLEPLAGAHAPVKPAIYAGGVFQEDARWWGSPAEPTPAIVIDNVASQANRLESELARMRAELGLPEIVLDLSGLGTLPPHLPRRLSGFRFPHRQADAYLRDAVVEGGVAFTRTPTGQALFDATMDRPAAILGWFPQALLLGFWQSHLGKKRSQAKLARSWVSEIVGYGPATDASTRTLRLGLKGDDLNLSITEPADFDEDDHLAEPWSVVEGSKKEKPTAGKSRKALSELGHGQVPVGGSTSLGPISFRAIEQITSVSFAGLRRITFDTREKSAAARSLVVAMGLVGHVAAFGRPFTLRSGCDLHVVGSSWKWLGTGSTEELDVPDLHAAIELFSDCRDAAAQLGLLEGGGWNHEPLVLTPSASLASAISKTWPLAPVDI